MPRRFEAADFGEWLPDRPDLMNPGANVANNAAFIAGVYHSLPAPTPTGLKISGVVKAVWASGTSRDMRGIAMTPKGFWRITNSGAYSISSQTMSAEAWQYTVYGPYLIVCDESEDTYRYDLDGAASVVSKIDEAPRGAFIATIRQFVMLGNVVDEDGVRAQRVRWCALDNPLSWKPDPETQADFQDLAGTGGRVTGLVGGEYGVIFQENSIWRATYIGAPLVFQFDEVEKGRGCLHGNSIVDIGNMPDGGRGIFYLALDGFYRFTGQTSIPLGVDKVNITIMNELDLTRIKEISGAANRQAHLVYWSVPTTDGSFVLYIYNYLTGNWSRAPGIKARWLGQVGDLTLLGEEGFLSGLSNNLVNGIIQTIDPDAPTTPTIPGLPNRTSEVPFTGIAMFDTDGNLCRFRGIPLDGELETGEVMFGDGALFTSQVRVLVAGSFNCYAAIGYRVRQSDPLYWTPYVAPALDGAVKHRVHARFVRCRVKLIGHWNEARGILYDVSQRGRR
jgi:hypothetical protein